MLKGLRHGDPSPILFNIVAGMFAILIAHSLSKGGRSGRWSYSTSCGGGRGSILQYVEDTLEHDLEKTVNLKLIIYIEHLLDLKTIFHKSEINCFGKAKKVEEEHKHIFGCETVSLPFVALIPTIIRGFFFTRN